MTTTKQEQKEKRIKVYLWLQQGIKPQMVRVNGVIENGTCVFCEGTTQFWVHNPEQVSYFHAVCPPCGNFKTDKPGDTDPVLEINLDVAKQIAALEKAEPLGEDDL